MQESKVEATRLLGGCTVVPRAVLQHLCGGGAKSGDTIVLEPDAARPCLRVMSLASSLSTSTSAVGTRRAEAQRVEIDAAIDDADVAVVVDLDRELRTRVGILDDDDVVWCVHDGSVELWARAHWLVVGQCFVEATLLPRFVVDRDRVCVGPFALWAPSTVENTQRWDGVFCANPRRRVRVITTPADRDGPSPLDDDIHFDVVHFGGDDADEFDDVDTRVRRVRTGIPALPACLVRCAHPGVTLDALLERDAHGLPPQELLVAVARALTCGARALRPVTSAADVVVGVDGVITVDGFDGPSPAQWLPWTLPTLDEPDACRRLVVAVFQRMCVDVDEVLRAVRDTAPHAANERLLVAGIVRGLAPDVVERAEAEAEALAVLDDRSWSRWTNDEVAAIEPGPVLDAQEVANLAELGRVTLQERERVLGELIATFARDVSKKIDAVEAHWQSGANRGDFRIAHDLVRMADGIGANQLAAAACGVRNGIRLCDDFDPARILRLRRLAERARRALCVVFGVGVHR